jgi:hypothetical protein
MGLDQVNGFNQEITQKKQLDEIIQPTIEKNQLEAIFNQAKTNLSKINDFNTLYALQGHITTKIGSLKNTPTIKRIYTNFFINKEIKHLNALLFNVSKKLQQVALENQPKELERKSIAVYELKQLIISKNLNDEYIKNATNELNSITANYPQIPKQQIDDWRLIISSYQNQPEHHLDKILEFNSQLEKLISSLTLAAKVVQMEQKTGLPIQSDNRPPNIQSLLTTLNECDEQACTHYKETLNLKKENKDLIDANLILLKDNKMTTESKKEWVEKITAFYSVPNDNHEKIKSLNAELVKIQSELKSASSEASAINPVEVEAFSKETDQHRTLYTQWINYAQKLLYINPNLDAATKANWKSIINRFQNDPKLDVQTVIKLNNELNEICDKLEICLLLLDLEKQADINEVLKRPSAVQKLFSSLELDIDSCKIYELKLKNTLTQHTLKNTILDAVGIDESIRNNWMKLINDLKINENVTQTHSLLNKLSINIQKYIYIHNKEFLAGVKAEERPTEINDFMKSLESCKEIHQINQELETDTLYAYDSILNEKISSKNYRLFELIKNFDINQIELSNLDSLPGTIKENWITIINNTSDQQLNTHLSNLNLAIKLNNLACVSGMPVLRNAEVENFFNTLEMDVESKQKIEEMVDELCEMFDDDDMIDPDEKTAHFVHLDNETTLINQQPIERLGAGSYGFVDKLEGITLLRERYQPQGEETYQSKKAFKQETFAIKSARRDEADLIAENHAHREFWKKCSPEDREYLVEWYAQNTSGLYEGDLYKARNQITDSKAKSEIAASVIKSCHVILKNGGILSDIKMGNILYKQMPNDQYKAVLADYGGLEDMSKLLEKTTYDNVYSFYEKLKVWTPEDLPFKEYLDLRKDLKDLLINYINFSSSEVKLKLQAIYERTQNLSKFTAAAAAYRFITGESAYPEVVANTFPECPENMKNYHTLSVNENGYQLQKFTQKLTANGCTQEVAAQIVNLLVFDPASRDFGSIP